MARIRTIKPEFWQDEKLGPLSPIDRLVFLGLISMADDAGRLVDSPRMLNGLLFPYTDDDCSGSLDLLADLGVIERGITDSGQAVVQIAHWDHQKIDRPNLAAALPPITLPKLYPRRVPVKLREAIYERDGGVCQQCGAETHLDKGHPRYGGDDTLAEIDHKKALADGGSNHPDNLRVLCKKCNRKKEGAERKARNQNELWDSTRDQRNIDDISSTHISTNDQRSTTNDQLPQPPFESEFSTFWEAYPLKVGKKAALKAFQARRREGVTPDQIMQGLKRYLAYKKATAERHHNPATFLGPNRWWDEPWEIPKEEPGRSNGRGGKNGPPDPVLDPKFKKPFVPIIQERRTAGGNGPTGNVSISLKGPGGHDA